MLRKISLALIGISLIVSMFVGYAIWKNTMPLVSPIALIEVMTGSFPALKSEKIVYGFFPYWNIKMSEDLNINQLTHFAYFAADMNPDGTINKINKNKEQEPGWNKLNSKTFEKLLYQTKVLGQRSVITITAMDPDTISSLTDNSQVSLTAVSSIMEVYRNKNFDDINIDFEYVGEPKAETRNGFTFFIKSLRAACRSVNPSCNIDIDVFADSAEKFRLWDLKALEPLTDRFIVMAYDYYRKGSRQAGPVAPLRGKCDPLIVLDSKCLDQDIVTHISQFSKILPPEKIILGIPFYGYEWQTAGDDYLASTYPGTGSMASYSRIQSLYSNPKVSSISAQWSELSLSPYLSYQEDGETFLIQYENAQSIEQKIKLVKSANLGGIAIWAIGYETPHLELWQSIKSLTTP